MKKLFGLRLSTAAVVVGFLSAILFLYASVHTSYSLAQFMTRDKVPNAAWIIDTDTAFFHVLYVCLSVALFIAAICLVVGGLKNNYKLLIPWLVVGTVVLIVLSLCLVYTLYVFIVFSINGWCVEATMVIVLFVDILVLALNIYVWRGVQQLYTDLTDCLERLKILPSTVPLYAPDEVLY